MIEVTALLSVGCLVSFLFVPVVSASILQPSDIEQLEKLQEQAGDNCKTMESKLEVSAKASWKRVNLKEAKLSVERPHSDKWLVDGKQIQIYQKDTGSISFGAYGVFEGCTLTRPYSLSWGKIRSFNQLLKLNEEKDTPRLQVRVGPWSGVIYRTSGLCVNDVLALRVGSKTVSIEPICGELSRDMLRVGASIRLGR